MGLGAAGFSVLYLISDLLEPGQGSFSTPQLNMTYVAEAAIPRFVLGLYATQPPRIGWAGLVSADWQSLERRLGVWLAVHSVLMLIAVVGFGIAVIRALVFPLWTGVTLIAGMLLDVITSGLPGAAQTASAGVRDLAFAAMGATDP